MLRSSDSGDFPTAEIISDEQRQLIIENSRLRQSNEQLSSELAKLQTQFDELVSACPRIEEVNEKNNELNKSISDSNIQLEEMKRRLEISLQMNKDLSEKMTASQSAVDSSYSLQISKLNSQILTLKAESKEEIEKLTEKCRKFESTQIQEEKEIGFLRNQNTKIISLSRNFFKKQFKDVDALCTFLMANPLQETSNNNICSDVNNNHQTDTVSQLEKKLENIKSQFNNEKLKRKQVQLAFLQYKKNNESNLIIIEEQKSHIDDLKRKHENSMKQIETSHKQEILNLSASLTPTIKYKSMMTQADLVSPEMKEKEKMEKKKLLEKNLQNDNNTQIIEQMKNQIESLMNLLRKGEEKQENLKEKNKSFLSNISQLEKELKSAQRKYLQTSTALQQLQQENESLNEQLKHFPIKSDENQMDQKIANIQLANALKAIEMLENVAASQKADIDHLTNERDHILSLVLIQNQTLESFEIVIENMKKSRYDIKESNFFTDDSDIINQSSSSIALDEPHITWNFGTLPESLVSILKRFTENDGFSIESKINHIFGVLSKWYRNIEISNNNENFDLKEKLEKSITQSDRFLSSLLNSLNQKDLSQSEVVKQVSDLYSNNILLQQKVNELEAFKNDTMDTSTESANPIVSKLHRVLKELNAKCRLRKRELKECKAAFIECQRRSADEINTLRSSNERVRKELNLLQSAHDKLYEQNRSLTEEISEVRESQCNEYTQSQEEFESILMQNSTNFDEFQNKTQRDLQKKDLEIARLKQSNDELTKSVNHWETMAKHVGEEIASLKSKLTKVQKECDERIAEVTKQREADIKDLGNHYKKANDQLMAKNGELMEQLREAKKPTQVIEFDTKSQELESQISQLTFQIQQDNVRYQAQADSLDRQNKLLQVQNRAKLMAAETRYSMKCEEMRKEFEIKKNDLLGFVAQQFRSFYDVKLSLNEDAVKTIVRKIKIEMNKLKKKEDSIRKIIGAKEGQSTEDALTELILSNHPQLIEQKQRSPK